MNHTMKSSKEVESKGQCIADLSIRQRQVVDFIFQLLYSWQKSPGHPTG